MTEKEAFPLKKALLVVDLQNDFCPGGALAIPEGDQIVPDINKVVQHFAAAGGLVAASRDSHPANHGSFISQHPGRQALDIVDLHGIAQVVWPDHCVLGSWGAEFHPDFAWQNAHWVFRKGFRADCDSYSAFWENDHKTATGLTAIFKASGIEEVLICGLATNFCVLYSALDSVALGFRTKVIWNLSRGIQEEAGALTNTQKQMEDASIQVVEYQPGKNIW